MKHACMRWIWTFLRMHEFSYLLSIASVDGKQHLSEVVFSALVWFSLYGKWQVPGRTCTPRTCHQWLWCSWSRVTVCGVQNVLGIWVRPGNQIFLSFSLQRKSDESSKHYLTQMLHVINWHYWQAGKNSHMRMKVQGRLMQVCFIEIHQVFEK